jgi:hypothetical protein
MVDTPSICLEVHAYDWVVRDAFEENDHVAIHCWALDRNSTAHLVRFTTFPAFCFIELPQKIYGRYYNWSDGSVRLFLDALSTRLDEHAPIRSTFQPSMKLYYYRQNRTFPIIQVCFQNLEHMRHCANLLKKPMYMKDMGHVSCNVWENQIPITRKLLTVQDVRYCQWFRVMVKEVNTSISQNGTQ